MMSDCLPLKKEARFTFIEVPPSLFDDLVALFSRFFRQSGVAVEAEPSKAVAGILENLSLTPVLAELSGSGFHVAGLGRSGALNLLALRNLGLRASEVPFSYKVLDSITELGDSKQVSKLLEALGKRLSAEIKISRALQKDRPVVSELAEDIAKIFGSDTSKWPTILYDLFGLGGQQKVLIQPKGFKTYAGVELPIRDLKSLLSDEVLALVGTIRPSTRRVPDIASFAGPKPGFRVVTNVVEPLLERAYERAGASVDLISRLRRALFATSDLPRVSPSPEGVEVTSRGIELAPVNAPASELGKEFHDTVLNRIASFLEDLGIRTYLSGSNYPANLTVLHERMNVPASNELLDKILNIAANIGRAKPTYSTRAKLNELIDLLINTPKVEFKIPDISSLF